MGETPLPKWYSLREVFILRLWRESPDDQFLRGQVQHVRSGKVTAVRSLQELTDYLEQFFQHDAQESDACAENNPGKLK